MANNAIRLAFEAQRSLGFGSIGASYTGIGTIFANAVRIIFVQNLTDQTVQFSLDGVTDHFVLPPNGFLLLDVAANKTNEQGFFAAQGDRLYAQEITTPTSGSVFLTVIYGESE